MRNKGSIRNLSDMSSSWIERFEGTQLILWRWTLSVWLLGYLCGLQYYPSTARGHSWTRTSFNFFLSKLELRFLHLYEKEKDCLKNIQLLDIHKKKKKVKCEKAHNYTKNPSFRLHRNTSPWH